MAREIMEQLLALTALGLFINALMIWAGYATGVLC